MIVIGTAAVEIFSDKFATADDFTKHKKSIDDIESRKQIDEHKLYMKKYRNLPRKRILKNHVFWTLNEVKIQRGKRY